MIYVFTLLQILRASNELDGDFNMGLVSKSDIEEIKGSISGLLWSHPSTEFDETSITLTRPGFGVIIEVDPKGWVQELVNTLGEERALLKTREESFHMTMFQVCVEFFKDGYDPNTLPWNIFSVFDDYIKKKLDKMTSSVDVPSCFEIRSCGEVMILGRDYPSHVVARVELKTIKEEMDKIKEKLNVLGYVWIKHFAKALEEKGYGGRITKDMRGIGVEGKGWKFNIGYTASKDYRTHITLGILRCGDPEYEKLTLWANGCVGRKINDTFSDGMGREEINEKTEELNKANENICRKLLEKFELEDLSNYPKLEEQVRNAKEGKKLDVNREVIDEWRRYLISSKLSDIQEKAEKTKGEEVKIIKLKYSTINMSRIQNFEPYSNSFNPAGGSSE
ncbi:hypothetical protein EROM_030020 [Encephalitozoon romaleae SJ-2008]|uniref:Uncharacterized protein n=1 Tax=Encephalitozoon romaleae (strain SJ-2008) TaxID=1178016 RepID=I6ZSN9_ENCRO|nr:hypothetical protein EROM_030020 [Encephalitozoon romaleae SJ-2008]AFN82621.1 hypothetical protein EROM_030020 [Encephalitozoon romaleae SJ-2008]